MATIACQGKTIRSVRAVLFDKDGTLANVESYLTKLGFERSRLVADQLSTDRPEAQRLSVESSVLAAFGLSAEALDPAGLLAVGSRYDNEIAAAACLATAGQGWIEAVSATKLAFTAAESLVAPKVEHTPLLPNVKALLHRLQAVGLKIGVVSSDSQVEVEAFVNRYELSEVIWYCGFSVDTLPKTDPNFLQFACDALSAVPSETLVIGDSAADYALANQGAAGFLGMTGGWRAPVRFAAPIVTFFDLIQVEAFH
ncbi:MAG: HAD family hydrolase [Phormidesmis sp.]